MRDIKGRSIAQSKFLALLLVGTMATGLLLRWRMTGASFDWLHGLDLRRAHSHLGFYGVLFPAAWLYASSGRGGGDEPWVPGGRLLTGYFLLALMSGVAFLVQGYGLVAISISTAILGVWLLFAWKNRQYRRLFERDWLASAPLAILFSAALIPIVAVLTRRDPALANQFARTFLTLLLFGVFVPSALRSVGASAPHAFGWLVSICAGAVYLTGLFPHPLMGFGLVWIAYRVFIGIKKKSEFSVFFRQSELRLHLLWMGFALGLGLTGFGILPHTYFIAIAGVHYLVLGPMLMTLGCHRMKLEIPGLIRGFYELSLIVMVTAIALQGIWISRFLMLQRIAAVSGTSLVISMLLAIFASARSKRGER